MLAVAALRGRGFGVHFYASFFACSQTLCGIPALGNFMPTDTEQTRRLCRRAVETGALDMIPAGRKRWRRLDRELDVEVYLAFYPGMREWLVERCAAARARLGPSPLASLLDLADDAMARGYDKRSGAQLGEALQAAEGDLGAASADLDVALYADFLFAARAMGTLGS